MATWTINDAAHLLRRAGFGGRQQDVLNLHVLGQEGAIAALLNYESVPDPAAAESYQLGLDLTRGSGVVLWQLYRMFASARPLQEKLAWFWHGLFTSSIGGSAPSLMVIQMENWRRHAGGAFLEFLKAMYKDPAMLLYLDNNQNVVGAPNENFAREVMELFTLGIGNYTETDIKEAARALTGWVVGALTRAPDADLSAEDLAGLGRLWQSHDAARGEACYRLALTLGLKSPGRERLLARLAVGEKRRARFPEARALWEEIVRLQHAFDPRPWEEMAKIDEHRRRDFVSAHAVVSEALVQARGAGAAEAVLDALTYRLGRLTRRLGGGRGR